jgi:N-acetylglutamate synthase-like GNAT family acetyltransferase
MEVILGCLLVLTLILYMSKEGCCMYKVKKLDNKNLINDLALFFHQKWGVPLEAYVESMLDSLNSSTGVPSWYYVEDNGYIIGGIGVIDNDFHKRKDLTPNICAVYVKEEYRKQGICRSIFDYAIEDLKKFDIKDVYLITSHTKLYEHLGFTYYGEIEENDGNLIRCYHRKIR